MHYKICTKAKNSNGMAQEVSRQKAFQILRSKGKRKYIYFFKSKTSIISNFKCIRNIILQQKVSCFIRGGSGNFQPLCSGGSLILVSN